MSKLNLYKYIEISKAENTDMNKTKLLIYLCHISREYLFPYTFKRICKLHLYSRKNIFNFRYSAYCLSKGVGKSLLNNMSDVHFEGEYPNFLLLFVTKLFIRLIAVYTVFVNRGFKRYKPKQRNTTILLHL